MFTNVLTGRTVMRSEGKGTTIVCSRPMSLFAGSSQAGKQKVLDDWRAQLQKKPTHLKAYQIDMIVREVRRGLKGNDK